MLDATNTKAAIKRSLSWMHLDGGTKDAVLLTFDDGPHPEHTPLVLRLLKEYRARAIFFVVGARIQRAPYLLKTILNEGHLIGNHSYAHPLDKRFWLGPYLRDLMQCQNAIERLTGHRPKFFRPPLGTLSFSSIVAPRLLGLTTVLWSVKAKDWSLRNANDARGVIDRLNREVVSKPVRNDIVLMHDDHPYIGEILETVLPQLAEQKCDLFSAVDSIR